MPVSEIKDVIIPETGATVPKLIHTWIIRELGNNKGPISLFDVYLQCYRQNKTIFRRQKIIEVCKHEH